MLWWSNVEITLDPRERHFTSWGHIYRLWWRNFVRFIFNVNIIEIVSNRELIHKCYITKDSRVKLVCDINFITLLSINENASTFQIESIWNLRKMLEAYSQRIVNLHVLIWPTCILYIYDTKSNSLRCKHLIIYNIEKFKLTYSLVY